MQSPAFQFYVQDFLTGTMHMTAEEIGAYILLLCHQWDKGALPDNDKELIKIARTKQKVIDSIRVKFAVGEDGRLRNMRLEKEREKQAAYREKMIEAGRKSGEARRAKYEPAPKVVQAGLNSSASLSTSSATSDHHYINKNTRVGNQIFDRAASVLMRERFAPGIAEMMMNQYRTLRLEDVCAQVDMDCPSGTIFTDERHLLNKFKSVATHMLKTKKEKYNPDKVQYDYSRYQ
jgi:uncharacterized protein YdaU (DUF1376 family)